jgi:hypothetical protein
MDGYVRHKRAPNVYGLSVQYNAGSSVDELAQAGQFRNTQISYQDEDVLQAAVVPLGYRLEIIQTPGGGFHHTCSLIDGSMGTILHALPPDAAVAISQAFRRKRNPHQVQ